MHQIRAECDTRWLQACCMLQRCLKGPRNKAFSPRLTLMCVGSPDGSGRIVADGCPSEAFASVANDALVSRKGGALRVITNLKMDYVEVFPRRGDGEEAVAQDLFSDGIGGGFGQMVGGRRRFRLPRANLSYPMRSALCLNFLRN